MAGTNGWDTVFAVRGSQLNAEWAKPGASPASFTQTSQTGLGPATFAGTFGAWQVVSGGSGRDIRIDAPFTNATLTVNGTTTNVPSGTAAMTAQATAPSASTPAIGIAGVTLDAINAVALPRGSTEESLARTVLDQWMDANLGAITLLFAVVDIDKVVAQSPGYEWLAPSEARIAVVDMNTAAGPEPIVAILTALQGTTAANLTAVVDADLIPSGSRAAFLISPDAFLRRFLQPAACVFFVDACGGNKFEIVQSGTQLRNTETLEFVKFKLQDNNEVQAKIGPHDFTITLDGSQLAVEFRNVYFDWSAGITAYYTFRATHTATLDANKRIELIQGEERLSGTIAQSTGVIAASVAAAFAEAVLFALIGWGVGRLGTVPEDAGAVEMDPAGGQANVAPVAVNPGAAGGGLDVANGLNAAGLNAAAREAQAAVAAAGDEVAEGSFWVRHAVKIKAAIWVLGTLGAVGVGMIGQIISWIGEGKIGTLPTVDTFMADAVKPQQWPGSGDFVATSAQFWNGLLIAGDVTPATPAQAAPVPVAAST